MSKIIQKILLLITLMGITSAVVYGQEQFPPKNLQWKKHSVNLVPMTITNYGTCFPIYNTGDYVGIILNYPPGTNQEVMEHFGIWLGAIVDGDTLVTTAADYESVGASERGYMYEVFPRFNDNDIIYTSSVFDPVPANASSGFFFEDNGKLNVRYKPRSEQDYICEFWDNKIVFGVPNAPEILQDHKPLNARFIQRTFAWNFFLYNKIVFYDYFIVNEGNKVWNKVHFSIYNNGHMGKDKNLTRMGDDFAKYDSKRKLMYNGDIKGGPDGDMINDALLGFRLIGAPKKVDDPSVKYSFKHWLHSEDALSDGQRFRWMAANEIQPDMSEEIPPGSALRILLSAGDFGNAKPGDTLHFTFALLVGDGKQDLFKYADAAQSLFESDFNVPISPPPPKFSVSSKNNGILLDWSWKPEYTGINPEEFEDKSRRDGKLKDFEGFRVYRSSVGPDGPWIKIAEYDKVDNYSYDIGLKYQFLDKGLVNGIKYWYSVTSFDIPEKVSDQLTIPSLESPKSLSVKVAIPAPVSEDIGNKDVFAVPNPYRGDIDYTKSPRWEYPTQQGRDTWFEIDRRIAFMNMPPKCKLSIYTVSGALVKTFDFEQGSGAPILYWNLLNVNSHAVASGLYYFIVESPDRDKQIGKFVIVK